MRILIEDKFGVNREISFIKQSNDNEDYFELEIRCNGDMICAFDMDISELEKLIKILKKS